MSNLTVFREISTPDGRSAHYVSYNGTVTVKVAGRYKSAPLRGGVRPQDIAEQLLRELMQETAA